jgi:hypothetical protein
MRMKRAPAWTGIARRTRVATAAIVSGHPLIASNGSKESMRGTRTLYSPDPGNPAVTGRLR